MLIHGGRNDLAMKAEEFCKLGRCEASLLGAAGMGSKQREGARALWPAKRL